MSYEMPEVLQFSRRGGIRRHDLQSDPSIFTGSLSEPSKCFTILED